MRIPQGLVELRGRLAIAGAKYVLNLVRLPLGLARFQFAPQPVIGAARSHQDDGIDVEVEFAAIVFARDSARARLRKVGAVLVQIAQGNSAGLDLIDPMTGVNPHALLEQHALVVERLHGEDAVLSDIGGVANVGDFLALIGHVLRERDAHEMSVAIEDQHAPARHRLAGGDLEGRQYMRQRVVGAGNRPEIRAAAIAAPVRAGGEDDAVGAIAKYPVGGHLADAELHFDVFLQLGELYLPVRDHPAPFVQARQGCHGLPVAAQLLVGLAQVHHIAALAQNARAFHARGSAAHHQHRARLGGPGEFLRMPAAAIFLADGHVLSAHDLAALLELRDADVAADALADIFDPAFRNFVRQEWIRDVRARGADDVEHAGTDQAHHVVRAGEAAVADHGYGRSQDRLALLDEWRHPTGLAKARGARILAPFGIVADLQRHGIDHAFPAKRLEHAYAIFAGLDASRAVQCVDLEARGDAAGTAESALQRMQQLDVEPRAVFKAAAVMIRAPIEARFEKLAGRGS